MKLAPLCLSSTLALLFFVSAARADNPVAAAAFREGREALKLGNYDLACARFKASDEAEPSGGARLNLGDCALRRKELVEAETFYRGAALLSEGERRTFAEQRAAAARALAGTLRLRWSQAKPAGGQVEVDGHAVEVPGDLAVNPGRHTVRIIASGFGEAPQSVDIAGGSTAQLDLAPTPTKVAPVAGSEPAQPAPRRTSRSPFSYVLMGVGGAAIAGGVITGLVAGSARDDLDSKCNGQKPCAPDVWARSDVHDDYDKAKMWALVSTTCFIGGAVALVAGGTLWLATAPSPGGQTVSLAGRF